MKPKNPKQPAKPRRQSPATTARVNIQNILATTDFSEASRAGARYAVALGKKLNAAVALLHVIEPPSRLSGVESVLLARPDSELTELAQKQLATLAKHESKGHVVVTSSVRTGKPFHEITTAAREDRTDLIVIATHGYTGLKHAWLGSTAERVVRHAACPVLVVRAPKPDA